MSYKNCIDVIHNVPAMQVICTCGHIQNTTFVYSHCFSCDASYVSEEVQDVGEIFGATTEEMFDLQLSTVK